MKSDNKPRYRAVHKALSRIEPRMARAVRLAAERLKDRIPYRKLEQALARGDVRAAAEIVNRLDIADVYLPAADILKESLEKGGKIAAKEPQ